MTDLHAGDAELGRSAQKHRSILAAATEIFLKSGYLGTNMDAIAAVSGVSKQTVYKHFASKEALFVEIVSSMTGRAGDAVHLELRDPATPAELRPYLEDYAMRQLGIVLTPGLMQLRRLVIGEVTRFPELARALYEGGPGRAMRQLAEVFRRLDLSGLLLAPDPAMAAAHFNWLVMSQSINKAMLLGDAGIPTPAQLRREAVEGTRVFLAAYGRPAR